MPSVHLLDYVAGNIRSLVNAIEKLGYDVEWIKSPEDVKNAEVNMYTYHFNHLHTNGRYTETYLAWCRPLRPLSFAVLKEWLS